MWAMGVILFMMLVGDFPFNSPNTALIPAKIVQGEYEVPKEILSKLSYECVDVLSKML